jgi:hypothetical protein
MTVEDGTGLSTASSYASVAEADAYHLLRGNSTWTGLDAVKEAALIRATSYITGEYSSRWPGYRSSGTQALDWPRSGALDADGYYQSGVPVAVKVATIEAALLELVTAGTLTEAQDRGGAIVREKVGPIETEYSDGAPTGTVYPAIKLALSRLVQPVGYLRRG